MAQMSDPTTKSVTKIVDAEYDLLLHIHAASVDALTEIACGSLPDQPATSGLDEREWAMQHIARLRRLARGGLTAASNIRFNETPTPKLTECTFCRSGTQSRVAKAVTGAYDMRLKCPGVGRDKDNEQSLCFYFNRKPSDDEMRYLHDVMQRASECSPIADPPPLAARLTLVS